VIVATTQDHIKAGVDFARERNLRLIIRNTGHDFMGRSTGYGSLIINTHSFKDVKFVTKYSGPGEWTGSAATVGAGVQGRELFRQCFAQSPKVVIVGGECPVCQHHLEIWCMTNSTRRSDGLEATSKAVDTAR